LYCSNCYLKIGKFNGPGGKQEDVDKNISETAIRETEEEIGIKVDSVKHIGCLEFIFNDKPSWNQHCFVFTTTDFDNSLQPIESEGSF
jgi:8-oxo-dGTP pyrophosphatase MutT (NUDIX family)